MAFANLPWLKLRLDRDQLRSAPLRWRLARALPADMRKWLKVATPLAAWQAVNHHTRAGDRDLRAALAGRSAALPRISVLMPVYRPSLEHLDAAIGSVREQIYDGWQLVMVDDASGDTFLSGRLAAVASQDGRIVHHRNSTNLGISATTNAAFAASDGDIVLFLDNDDLLSPDCLAETALFFAENPDFDMVYSDHDKIDLTGRQVSPQFKPDWSPTLLLSYMYLGHVVAVRRNLFERVGGLRPGFEGSQDYDFALRAAESARRVGHIPKILYHWRMTPGSTAVSGAEKPGSFDAGAAALRDALDRRGVAARAFRPDWARRRHLGLFALDFEGEEATVDVIVPAMEGARHLPKLLRMMTGTTYEKWSLMFVASEAAQLDEAVETARRMLGAKQTVLRVLLHEGAAKLADLCNAGAANSSSEALLFLLDAFEPTRKDWLKQLAGHLNLEGVGAAGPRFITSNGRVVQAGLISSSASVAAFAGADVQAPGPLHFARTPHECNALPAHGLLVRSEAFAKTGSFESGLDDSVMIGMHFAARLSNNSWRQLICADVDAVAAISRPENRMLAEDPYYNPNFATEPPIFEPRPWTPPLRRNGPVRVLFVSHNLELEGAPIVLFDLVAGLVEAKAVEATILSPRNGPLAARYRERGIEVDYFNMPVLRHDTAQLALCLDRLGAAIQCRKPDLVFANTLEMAFAVNAAHAQSIGAVLWHHEAGSWRTAFRRYPDAVRGSVLAALGQAYRTVFVASATRDKWLPVCMRDNFHVIPHAQAPSRIAANRERWTRQAARTHLDIGDAETCVLLLGSICARKGQIDLVRAAAVLPEGLCSKTRFLIVGPVVQQRYGRRFDRELDRLPADVRSRIDVVGGVEDVELYYRAADVFVGCSRAESAPRVLLEAMSFGLPIVTTMVDGIPEMVGTPSNVLNYEAGEAKQLAAHLATLIETAAIRAELGRRAAHQFTCLPGYENMLAAFRTIILEAARTSDAPWLTLPAHDG